MQWLGADMKCIAAALALNRLHAHEARQDLCMPHSEGPEFLRMCCLPANGGAAQCCHCHILMG